MESPLESEAMLLRKLGWQGSDDDDVPVAVLERLACGDDSDGYWFRADPVNLQEDQSFLMMSYPSALNLTLDESKALTDSINEHFAEDGWHVEVMETKRWYLKLDKDPHIQTTPMWRAAGRDIFNLMPAGENSTQWHSWLMELQMLLFNHPVNEKRVEQGLATANGLWLWGGGYLPELPNKHQYGLRGDSQFMQGVARQYGCELKDLSDDFESGNQQLMLLEHARIALQTGNLNQGIEALIKLEKDVFKPLYKLMKSKNLDSMSLVDSPGKIVDFSSSGLNKWWRRRNVDINIID